MDYATLNERVLKHARDVIENNCTDHRAVPLPDRHIHNMKLGTRRQLTQSATKEE